MIEQPGWPVSSVSWPLLWEEGGAAPSRSLLSTPRTPAGGGHNILEDIVVKATYKPSFTFFYTVQVTQSLFKQSFISITNINGLNENLILSKS